MLGATVPAGNWTPAPVPFAGGPRETLAQCNGVLGCWDSHVQGRMAPGVPAHSGWDDVLSITSLVGRSTSFS